MGMQIHFNSADFPENTIVTILHHTDSDTWSALIKFPNCVNIEVCAFSAVPSGDFCFDCGQWTEHQRFLVGMLVTNRVCFTAS